MVYCIHSSYKSLYIKWLLSDPITQENNDIQKQPVKWMSDCPVSSANRAPVFHLCIPWDWSCWHMCLLWCTSLIHIWISSSNVDHIFPPGVENTGSVPVHDMCNVWVFMPAHCICLHIFTNAKKRTQKRWVSIILLKRISVGGDCVVLIQTTLNLCLHCRVYIRRYTTCATLVYCKPQQNLHQTSPWQR